MKLKTKTLVTALACTPGLLLFSNNAQAQLDPYANAYGVQWNYMIGTAGADLGGGSSVALTDDGTVFIQNRTTNNSTWGSGITNNLNGGVGAINPYGDLLFGTTLSSLPGYISPGQNYVAGGGVVGNTAFFTFYGAQGQHWTGEDGKDGNRAMVYSLDSSGLGSIANQHSLSAYKDNAGALRTDLLAPTTTGLTPVAGQNRISWSDINASKSMVMVMDMVAGDFATAGDYEGFGNRFGGTGDAYMPGIGVYNFDTNTLVGPSKQPVLLDTDLVATNGSNMGVYLAAGIDNSGHYYGGGLSHSRTESTSDSWDPDGSGSFAPIALASQSAANPAGIGTAYDASNNLLYAVTWDTAGYDRINVIAATNDGTNASFWGGEKNDVTYIEKRDAAGNVVWSDTVNESLVDGVQRISNVEVDGDGNLIVMGYFSDDADSGAAGTSARYDTFVRKYEKTGTDTYAVQWTKTLGNDGANDFIRDAAVDATGDHLYVLSDAFSQYSTINGHTYAGNSDILLQKLSPGDVNSDGLTDQVDLNQIGLDALDGTGTNTVPGDFTGNNLIEHNDVQYMITNVFDAAGYGDANMNGVYEIADLDIVNKQAYANSQGGGAYSALNDWDLDGGNTDYADRDAWLANRASANGFASPFKVGDTNLDGDVDVFQFDGNGDAQVLSSNLGQSSGQTWADGDFNGDGDVDVFQFDGGGDAQLLSANLGASSLAAFALSGISGALGQDAAAGTAEAIYNIATGELIFDIGSGVAVVGLQSIGNVIPGNVDNGSIFGAPIQLDANTIAFFNAGGLTVGEDSLGFVLTPGLTQGELGFSYTPIGGATTVVDVTIIPEPSSLALLGLGGLLLARRRRA